MRRIDFDHGDRRQGKIAGPLAGMRTDGKLSSSISLIKTAMIEKKMTQAELADASDCHEKTIQNLLAGKAVRDQTLFDVCMVLGLDFDKVRRGWKPEARDAPDDEAPVEARAAPAYMGAYTRAGVDHYLGSYLTIRPSFAEPNAIMAYRTDISWDDDWPSLLFQERDRPDKPFLHRGRLYIPTSSMYIHLVSLTKGAMRMIMVSQVDPMGCMRGLITTLHKQRSHFVPVSTPIVYLKRDAFPEDTLGVIASDSPHHGEYQKLLAETLEQGYARLIDF